MRLLFGFEEYPYADRYGKKSPLTATTKKGRAKVMTSAQANYGQGKTTTEVAAELEEKYHICEEFFSIAEDDISELFEEQVALDIEAVMSGEPVQKVIDKKMDRIERMFRQSLSNKRFDYRIPGVPTLAAQRGVSHLTQHPYKGGRNPRPSFIDTGMYQRSFRAWLEED